VKPALARSFYLRGPVDAAKALLGKIVVHGATAGRIVETEAYLGTGDLAAHSAHGETARTKVVFGPPGHAYVYFIYGMYDCLNVVVEPEGVAGAVLIRALEPVEGIEEMKSRRGVAKLEQLANGPGKLTRAMGITMRHNGTDLIRGPITVHPPGKESRFEIAVSPRIGITKSPDLPLRFYIKDNRFVSRIR
jgi:DNA-3-methyladenine glycosylase